jgi:hypothetical protein
LLLACVLVGVPAAIVFILATPLHRVISFALGAAIGGAFYLVVTSVLYRRWHLFPLLLPGCPHCHDANRHYYTLSRAWPREIIQCAMCQTKIELCMVPTNIEVIDSERPTYELLWPYSFGGRWRLVSSSRQRAAVTHSP